MAKYHEISVHFWTNVILAIETLSDLSHFTDDIIIEYYAHNMSKNLAPLILES